MGWWLSGAGACGAMGSPQAVPVLPPWPGAGQPGALGQPQPRPWDTSLGRGWRLALLQHHWGGGSLPQGAEVGSWDLGEAGQGQ